MNRKTKPKMGKSDISSNFHNRQSNLINNEHTDQIKPSFCTLYRSKSAVISHEQIILLGSPRFIRFFQSIGLNSEEIECYLSKKKNSQPITVNDFCLFLYQLSTSRGHEVFVLSLKQELLSLFNSDIHRSEP